MIDEINRFFGSKKLASTYKPTFLKCLLDIGDCKTGEGTQWIKHNGNNYEVNLDFIAVRFIRFYFPLKFTFKLKQQATSSDIAVYRILEEFFPRNKRKSTPSKKRLCGGEFAKLRNEIIKDGIKPQVLKKLLNDCNIYNITKSDSIEISEKTVAFLTNNKNMIYSALNQVITEYLEKINFSPNITVCLKEKTPRSSLSTKLFQKIIGLQNSCCFYCKKVNTEFEQEHLIPFNFVRDTQAYNIVASCINCNGTKNDKLPNEEFLKELLDRNNKFQELVPYGYSQEMMKNLYKNCWTEYHGNKNKLWKP